MVPKLYTIDTHSLYKNTNKCYKYYTWGICIDYLYLA